MFAACRVLLLAATVVAAPVRAADWLVPPLEGELRGQASPTLLPGAPAVNWKLSARRVDDERREIVLTVDGDGLGAQLEALVNLNSGDGTWTLRRAQVDLGPWFRPLGARVSAAPGAMTAGGAVTLTGSGQVQGGVPSGQLDLTWRDGRLQNEADGWVLEGISWQGSCAFDAAGLRVRSVQPVKFSIQTITTSRFGARNLEVVGELKDRTTLEVSSAAIEIAGGTAVAKPFTVALQPPAATVHLRLSRIGLQDVAALVPDVVRAAFGRVDGEVRVGWSEARGLEVGDGQLVLRNDEAASVKLAPSPGLITSHLPARIIKYYPGLDKVELGLIPIRADQLDVTFSPDGDAQGRTAVIYLSGVPHDPKAQAPVHLNFNVRGPLTPFIKLGTNTKFSFGLK